MASNPLKNLKRRMKVKPAGMGGMTGTRLKVKRMKAYGGSKKFGAYTTERWAGRDSRRGWSFGQPRLRRGLRWQRKNLHSRRSTRTHWVG
jgi:hypothetical protein